MAQSPREKQNILIMLLLAVGVQIVGGQGSVKTDFDMCIIMFNFGVLGYSKFSGRYLSAHPLGNRTA